MSSTSAVDWNSKADQLIISETPLLSELSERGLTFGGLTPIDPNSFN